MVDCPEPFTRLKKTGVFRTASTYIQHHAEHVCRLSSICYLTIHDRVSIVSNICAKCLSECFTAGHRGATGDGAGSRLAANRDNLHDCAPRIAVDDLRS